MVALLAAWNTVETGHGPAAGNIAAVAGFAVVAGYIAVVADTVAAAGYTVVAYNPAARHIAARSFFSFYPAQAAG